MSASSSIKVLIAVDESEYAEYAVNWYLTHLHKAGNEVILGHVADPGINPSFAFRAGLAIPPEEWNLILRQAEEKVKVLRHKHVEVLKNGGVEHVKFRAEQGRPESHLVDMVNDTGVQMVVIGTRGMGTVRRTILGSVSDHVLHHVNVPVVICRKPEVGPPPHDHTQL